MKTITRTITLLSLCVLLLAGLASAQYFHPAIRSNIPFEFSAGNKILPPGTYRLVRATPFSFFLMDSTGRARAVLSSTAVWPGRAPAATKLVFYADGGRYVLAQAWMESEPEGREFVHRRKVAAVAELGAGEIPQQAAARP